MYDNPYVVQLSPGATEEVAQRPDWTPMAQPPDPRTGIMAHTPGPADYHDAGSGRTMLPRSTTNWGSRGFSTEPGIVHVDPSNPFTGEGGISVDLADMDKQFSKQAFEAAQGNPITAMMLGAQRGQEKSGHVVPPATSGGGTVHQSVDQQLPAAVALAGDRSSAAPLGVKQSNSVKRRESPVPAPQRIPEPITPTTSFTPAVAPAQAYSEPQPQPPTQPQPQIQPSAVAPAPQVIYQPMPDQGLHNTVSALAEQMRQLSQAVTTLSASQATPSLPTLSEPRSSPEGFSQGERQEMLAEIERLRSSLATGPGENKDPEWSPEKEVGRPSTASNGYHEEEYPAASADDVGLPFLTTPPSKPKVTVVFDLGEAGVHQKKFHYVTAWGLNLALFYDNRYDGDRFLPPSSKEGKPPMKLSFPGRETEEVYAYFAGDYNVRMGCMDVLLFVLAKQEETPRRHSTQPMMPDVTDFGEAPGKDDYNDGYSF